MATREYNLDLDVKGSISATTVPNSTGSVVTWNASTKVFGLRTNAQIISDLGLTSVVNNSHTHNNKSVLDGITSTNVNNWNTAFGWGDFRVYGLGLSASQGNISNADTHTPTSFGHTGSSFIGSPFAGVNGANQGYLNTLSWGGGNLYKFQEHIPINSNIARRYRSKVNGVWGDWVTSIDTNNLDSQATSLGFVKSSILSDYIPYTGANQPVNFNTQSFRIGGDFNKSVSTFERSHLFSNETSPQHFTRLTDVASFSRSNDSTTQSDCIVITLPIKVSTRWVMEVDIFSPFVNRIFGGIPTKLLIGAYATSNSTRSVTAISGADNVKSVSFCRDINNNTVIIIRPQDGDSNYAYGKVNIANFYHSVSYNSALADKSNYSVTAVLESDLTGLTTQGTITNEQFTRDSYLWNKGNFSQSDINNWNTAFGWGNHAGLYPSRANLGSSANSVLASDTRSTNPLPTTDLKRGVWFDFKQMSTIGAGTGSSAYGASITFVPYGDDSGNDHSAFRLTQSSASGSNIPQLFVQKYRRGAWYDQYRIWHEGNLSQSNIDNWNAAFSWGNFRDYGLGTNSIVNNDWDSITETGFYRNSASSAIGMPIQASNISLYHLNHHTTVATQISIRSGSDQMWFRRKTGGVWQPWVELYHTGNFNPSLYLPLSGGTMTGDIDFSTVNTLGISKNGVKRLRFTTTETVLSSTVTGSTAGIVFRPQGDTVSTSQVTINGNGQINTYYHGDSSQWKQAYDWGDFRDYGLGTEAVVNTGLLENTNETGFYAFSTNQQGFNYPRAMIMKRGSQNYGLIFQNSGNKVGFLTADGSVYTAWHSGNLTNVSQLNNDAGFVTTDTTYSAGTLALLQAGTNTSNRVWSAKILADYVTSMIPTSILSYSSANGIIVTDWNSFALSEYAISLGYGSVTSGNYATSVGSLLSTTGFGSTNQGYSNSITKALGYSVGAYNSISATLAGAFGIGLINRNDGAFIVGRYNSLLPIEPYDTTSPHKQVVFAIGAGRDETDRFTALTVYGDGRADYAHGYDDSNWTDNTLVTKKWVQDNVGGSSSGGGGVAYRNVTSGTFNLSTEYDPSLAESVFNVRGGNPIVFIGGDAVFHDGYKVTIMTNDNRVNVSLDSSREVKFIDAEDFAVSYVEDYTSITFIYDKEYSSFRVYHKSFISLN